MSSMKKRRKKKPTKGNDAAKEGMFKLFMMVMNDKSYVICVPPKDASDKASWMCFRSDMGHSYVACFTERERAEKTLQDLQKKERGWEDHIVMCFTGELLKDWLAENDKQGIWGVRIDDVLLSMATARM